MRRCYVLDLVFTVVVVFGCCLQAPASQVQTLSNPVADGTIIVDGDLSDWAAITPYDADTVGDGSTGTGRPLDIDILQGAAAHDSQNFYFLYRMAGDNMVDPYSNWIILDMDQDANTGFNAGTSGIPFSINAEFNLGGTLGWNQWNADGSYAGPAVGQTVATGDSDGSGEDDFIEYAVSRSAIQPLGDTFNPSGPQNAFNLIFVAEDSVPDYSPNNGDVDWFTYNVPEPSAGLIGGCALIGLLGLSRRRRR